jgi:hypothetical protein
VEGGVSASRRTYTHCSSSEPSPNSQAPTSVDSRVPPCSARRRRCGNPTLVASHSQTVNTRQPASRSPLRTRASRRTFRAIFSSQKTAFDFGLVRPFRHAVWPCQKHPCTSMTIDAESITMSGAPGRVRTLQRNCSPTSRSFSRTINSAAVPLWRTARIISVLRVLLTESILTSEKV